MGAFLSGIVAVVGGDTLFLLSIFTLFFVSALYFGRGHVISYILAYFPAAVLYSSFPFLSHLIVLPTEKLIVVNKLVIFLVFLLPLTIIINRYIFTAGDYNGASTTLKSLGFASSATIIFLLFCYTTVNIDLLHDFSPQIDALFIGSASTFCWTLASLGILAIL